MCEARLRSVSAYAAPPNAQVAVRTEDITISGGIVRQQMKYDRFKNKAMVTCPRKGPYHYRAPSKILWRTIRGRVRPPRVPFPPPPRVP